ncbi:hypothetical protein [Paraburkholderia sp. SIMBA_054]|uniref:hypothetical protein n=1 Tax=Paraburkholderia sp. SIMBA_054 TaxID=3085795 RepID=UPI00397DABD6
MREQEMPRYAIRMKLLADYSHASSPGRMDVMTSPPNLDLRAQTELLTYLVASQLLAKSATGEWLAIEHQVDLSRLWLVTHGDRADSLQRVSISSWAQRVAERVDMSFPIEIDVQSALAMFSERPRLEFGAPFVRTVYQVCLNHLANMCWLA